MYIPITCVDHSAFGWAQADGTGALTIESDPLKLSSIVNNGTDVNLEFVTRAAVDGVTMGSIVCDAMVLSPGSTVDP